MPIFGLFRVIRSCSMKIIMPWCMKTLLKYVSPVRAFYSCKLDDIKLQSCVSPGPSHRLFCPFGILQYIHRVNNTRNARIFFFYSFSPFVPSNENFVTTKRKDSLLLSKMVSFLKSMKMIRLFKSLSFSKRLKKSPAACLKFRRRQSFTLT